MSSKTRSSAGNLAAFTLLALLAIALLRLHRGDWWLAEPTPSRYWLAALSLLLYLLGCLCLIGRRHTPASADPPEFIVAWASQSGFARELAEHSVSLLLSIGRRAHALPLQQLDTARLAAAPTVLFIVSTSGEGDAPDHAQPFVRETMHQQPSLPSLRYAVLALGDRSYGHFCGFGRRLEQWLQHCGAHALFDRIDVDAADADALRQWHAQLGQCGDRPTSLPDWQAPHYRHWRLQQRILLNPGSDGGEVYRITLLPEREPLPNWRAGDIAEIGPRHGDDRVEAWLDEHGVDGARDIDGRPLRQWLAQSRLPTAPPATATAADLSAWRQRLTPLPHREYSIASVPDEGRLELLLRLHNDNHGHWGLGSGWLCRHASVGAAIDLRIRSNPNFHGPSAQTPLLLIGNGTGIAGLRAQLRERIAAGARRNWLLFGERNAAHDLHFGEELHSWRNEGWLERLDTVFSRDGDGQKCYVQHRLRAHAEILHAWVDDGAWIMVCGSLRGMAPAIEQVLDDCLGASVREQLVLSGRYRRDVY